MVRTPSFTTRIFKTVEILLVISTKRTRFGSKKVVKFSKRNWFCVINFVRFFTARGSATALLSSSCHASGVRVRSVFGPIIFRMDFFLNHPRLPRLCVTLEGVVCVFHRRFASDFAPFPAQRHGCDLCSCAVASILGPRSGQSSASAAHGNDGYPRQRFPV